MNDEETCDVVVVGSGCAGLAAAQSAAMRGADVVVLERAGVVGGTTAISGGGMWLPCSSLAKAQGYDDSPDDVRTYLHRLAVGKTSPALIDAFVETAPEAFEMLASTGLGFELTSIPDYKNAFEGSCTGGRTIWPALYDSSRLGNRRHMVRECPRPGPMPSLTFAEMDAAGWGMATANQSLAPITAEREAAGILGQGRALTAIQLEACLTHGARIETGARFIDLIVENGRVAGVSFEREEQTHILRARRGVVLASGGFEWNLQMWRDLVGVPLDQPLSPPGNDGAALSAAAKLGARIGNVGEIWWMPGIEVTGETYDGEKRLRMGASGKSLPGAIVVNKTGARFANESMNYNDFGFYMVRFDPETYSFPNYPAFVVFDASHRETYMPVAYDGDRHDGADWIVEAATIRELAGKLGVDADGLERQVAEFNRNAAEGRDPQFARGELAYERSGKFGDATRANPNLAPVDQPPFYGYALKVSCLGTKGGPVINERSEVLGQDGLPIPGLYAAGNAAAAVFGSAYPGGGSTLGAALTFGYIAGRSCMAAVSS